MWSETLPLIDGRSSMGVRGRRNDEDGQSVLPCPEHPNCSASELNRPRKSETSLTPRLLSRHMRGSRALHGHAIFARLCLLRGQGAKSDPMISPDLDPDDTVTCSPYETDASVSEQVSWIPIDSSTTGQRPEIWRALRFARLAFVLHVLKRRRWEHAYAAWQRPCKHRARPLLRASGHFPCFDCYLSFYARSLRPLPNVIAAVVGGLLCSLAGENPMPGLTRRLLKESCTTRLPSDSSSVQSRTSSRIAIPLHQNTAGCS